MNTKTRGDISEIIVMGEFLKFGYSVSKPFGDNQPYDIIIDIRGELKKVQIKSAIIRKGCVIIRLCSSVNTYIQKGKKTSSYKGKADFIVAYCDSNKTCYLIDVMDFGENALYLRMTPALSNRKAKVTWAESFKMTKDLIEQHVFGLAGLSRKDKGKVLKYDMSPYSDAAPSKNSFRSTEVSEELLNRFFSKIKKVEINNCWIWGASKRSDSGYGAIKVFGKVMDVHRLSYYIFYGDIPDDKHMGHTCNNRLCVNPDHLFLKNRFGVRNMCNMKNQ